MYSEEQLSSRMDQLNSRRSRGELSESEWLELGLILAHIDFGVATDDAIEIFDDLAAKRGSLLATLWSIYYRAMVKRDDKSIERALNDVLRVESAQPTLAAAAYQLHPDLVFDTSRESVLAGVAFLHESVRLKPLWVLNNASLAHSYHRLGEWDAALHYVQIALNNCRPGPPNVSTYADWCFSATFIGSHNEREKEDLQHVWNRMSSGMSWS